MAYEDSSSGHKLIILASSITFGSRGDIGYSIGELNFWSTSLAILNIGYGISDSWTHRVPSHICLTKDPVHYFTRKSRTSACLHADQTLL